MPPILARPGLHTSGFYFSYFAATGVHLPFWPLWLGDWGLSAAEVGYFTAVGIGVRVVAGIAIPALADRLDAWRLTFVACAIATAALFVGHLAIGSATVLLLATAATGAGFAAMGPISEALGIASARAHHFPYAQARGLGSIGFLGANLLVGALMARWGSDVALWWIVAALGVVALLGLGHPGGGGLRDRSPPRFREIGRLIGLPTFAIFMTAAGFIQASHATYYALGSVHWRDLGIGEARIGALWGFSVAVEVLVMVVGGAFLMERVGAIGSLVISGIAGILRWGAMMADPTGLMLWPLQALHSITFGAGHLGAMTFIARAVPARYGAAAQGASGAMAAGLLMALGMALSAAIYPSLGGRTYAIGLAFSAAGLVSTLALASLWRGEELSV